MSEYNDGGPAFPVVDPLNDVSESGMTLRDYFAGKALQSGWLRSDRMGGPGLESTD